MIPLVEFNIFQNLRQMNWQCNTDTTENYISFKIELNTSLILTNSAYLLVILPRYINLI